MNAKLLDMSLIPENRPVGTKIIYPWNASEEFLLEVTISSSLWASMQGPFGYKHQYLTVLGRGT